MNYRFELTPPGAQAIDITERVSLDGLSKLTWTAERNLHEFRCSDLTLTLDDGDGFFRGLFAGIGPDDRWRLTAERDGARFFAGHIPPFDSIHFDRKEGTVEVTALDLSKLAEETSAETVARSVTSFAITSGSSGSKTLNLADTAGLFNGDTISLADGANEEEVVIALVKTSTQVLLIDPMSWTYTSAGVATLVSSGFRFQKPSFLVEQLFAAAPGIITGTRIKVTDIPRIGAPIIMGQGTNLITSQSFPAAFTQKDGKHLLEIGGVGAWEQGEPDEDWSSVSNVRWADWTPYRTQAEGEPASLCNPPNSNDESYFSYDYTPGAFVAYLIEMVGSDICLRRFLSSTGTSWGAVGTLKILGTSAGSVRTLAWDFDSTRNRVYYYIDVGSVQEFGYYDIAGATQVPLALHAYKSIRYSKEADLVAGFYGSGSPTVEFWRGAELIAFGNTASRPDALFTRTLRYLSGFYFYCDYKGNVPRLHFSDDLFATETMIELTDAVSTPNNVRVTVVNGTIRIVCVGSPGNIWYLFIVAWLDNWRVDYADFSQTNVANALDDLAILMNAIFYVDHSGVGYFVHRDLDSGNSPYIIPDEGDAEASEIDEVPLWLETYSYVEVRLGETGFGAAGMKTSRSRNLEVRVDIDGPDALAKSIAAYLLSFFVKRRAHVHLVNADDGAQHVPLDKVTWDGRQWLILGFERDLGQYVRSFELIEKVA